MKHVCHYFVSRAANRPPAPSLCPCALAALAYFVAACSSSMGVANAVVPTYLSTLLFFTGFVIRRQNIPDYWIW